MSSFSYHRNCHGALKNWGEYKSCSGRRGGGGGGEGESEDSVGYTGPFETFTEGNEVIIIAGRYFAAHILLGVVCSDKIKR